MNKHIRLRWIAVLTLCVSLLLPVFAQADESDYVRLMGEADEAIADSDWRRADSLLVTALRLEPGNPMTVMLMSNLGMIRFYAGNDSLAMATLNAAHDMAPKAVVVLANRAVVRAQTGDADGAFDDWNTILQLDSAHVGARYLRSMEALRRNDVALAEADVKKLRAIAPDDPRSDLAEATLFSSTARYTEAIGPLTRSIEAQPGAELYAARALCYLMTGSLNEASSDIADGLRLDPADAELYLYRAILNKMRYRNDDALDDARRAVKLGIPSERVEAMMR